MNLHPKIRSAAQVAAFLLAVDAVVVALTDAVPSPQVVAFLVALHSVLPVIAGYLKSA